MNRADILPKAIQDKVKNLYREGFSTEEVFNRVLHEAIGYVDSQEMLERCIASLEGKVTQED